MSLGNIFSAVGNIVGGLIGKESQEDEIHRQNTVYWQNVKREENARTHAIQDRVRDAKAAGIHPLYALGASVPSFSPSSVAGVSGNPMGSALAAAGQDISRAVNAGMPADARAYAWDQTMRDLSVTNTQLKNELLRSQIQKINQAGGTPPAPTLTADNPSILPPVPQGQKQEDMPPLQFGGYRVKTAPDTSNTEEAEKRYGDEAGGWVWGLGTMMRDFQYNLSSMKFLDMIRAIDQATQMKWLGASVTGPTGKFKPGRR